MTLKPSWPWRYGLAALAALVAVWLRWALEPVIGTSVAFITVFPAMMLVAITLGAGPGLLSSALGIFLVEWHFIGPAGIELTFSVLSRAAILLATSAYVGWVSTRLRAARAQADLEAASAHAAEAALLRQVELIDSARAEIIAREMQRLVRERERAGTAPSAPAGERLRHVPAAAGAAAAVLGAAVLLGWLFDVEALKRVAPELEAMKANTALCFLLSGLALLQRGRRALLLTLSALVCAVAGLTLAEYASGWDIGLDQLLFADAPDAHTLYPGRMGPVTALCFALSSASLLLLAVPRGRWPQQAQALTLALCSLTGLLGYLYDVKPLYQFGGATSMAVHTAAGFLVLSVGLLFAREDGLARVLAGAGPGSQLARRFLPAAVLLPVLLGWLHEAGERTGVWGAPVGAGLLVLMLLFSLLAVVWWIAQALNRADAARRETEAQLRHQSELMDHANEALIIREPGGAIRFWNQGAASLFGWSAAEALGQRAFVLLRTERAGVTENDAQLLRTGHWEGELAHTTRDGRRVVVESRQTATHAADGRVLILQSDRDVTARKQAEAALHQLNAELEEANRQLRASRAAELSLVEEAVASRQEAERSAASLLESEARVRRKLDAVLAPEGDLGTLELADLLDTSALQLLMDDFYPLAHTPMAILDLKGRVLVKAGWQDICTCFHRVHAEACRHCLESDTELSAGLAAGEHRLYKCKNNLWDMATPIFVAGRHVGNIFAGQFFFAEETVDRELFRAQARAYGFDEEAYLAALDRIPRLSRETAERGMAFFRKLADMVSRLSYSNVKLARLLAERDRLTDSLRQSESFYRQTLESVPGMTFTTRPDGYCDFQSQQWVEFTGVPMSEHLGDGWCRLLHPDDCSRAHAAWCAAVEGRAPYDLEYRVRRHDGAYEWFKVCGRPIRNADGSIVRWFGTAVNIDTLVRAQAAVRQLNEQLEQRVRERTAQLEAANRELEAFCYSVSHDLRTPLRTIDGFSQAALEDYGERLDAVGRDYLSRVRNGCRHMDQLIDDLLNLSRVTREQMRHETVDLTALAQAAVAQLRERSPGRDVDVRIASGLTAAGDARLLRAAFFNLLDNAWKFTAKTPAAVIEVGAESGGLRPPSPPVFFVRDNGVGFDMQYAGKLFNAFQRLHTVQEFPGTGIGLATVARVIQRHGGRIWADASVGRGATFYFTLEPEPTATPR